MGGYGTDGETGYLTKLSYDADSNIEYVGAAKSGTLVSTAAWKIMKFGYTNNNLSEVTYPSGLATYDYIWNNRTTYTYS